MAQHHRLSPSARDINVLTVQGLTDLEIATLFAKWRWDSEDKQACTSCGTLDTHYPRRRRRRISRRPASSAIGPNTGNPSWQCKHCYAVFSLTSGTIFDSTKLSLRLILLGAVIMLTSGNGTSAVAAMQALGVSYKTAFLMLHRFREVMALDQPTEPIKGIAQMDGGYFCGKPRKSNVHRPATRSQMMNRYGKQPMPGELKPWEQAGMSYRNWMKKRNKRVVLAVTDSSGGRGEGSRSVAVAVSQMGETELNVRSMAAKHVAPGAMIWTDEAGAYNQLGRDYEHYAVSHAERYVDPEGVTDNHCESFFSRLRRAEYGVYHGFRPVNLHFYACEAAWRHTHRRLSKKAMVDRLMSAVLQTPPSTRLRGYHAGKGIRTEILID